MLCSADKGKYYAPAGMCWVNKLNCCAASYLSGFVLFVALLGYEIEQVGTISYIVLILLMQ